MAFHRVYSSKTDRATGIVCDPTIALDGVSTQHDYPDHLRRVRFKEPDTGKTLVFLTNQMALPSATIRALYKHRWQVGFSSSGSSSTCGSSASSAPRRT